MVTEDVGSELRALRTAIGFTQQEVATRAGIARVNMVRLESGALKGTKADTRRALAKAFGVPYEPFDSYLRNELTLEGLLKQRVVVAPAARPTGTEG